MSKPLSRDEILYLQRTCACCGLYSGPIDGKWSPAVDQAELDLDARSQALRAEIGQFDPRTEKNISTLMPPAQKVAREFMKAASALPLTVRIISGSRTYAEQDALYAIGRTIQTGKSPVTNARGGRSNHNFGVAWDVGIFDSAGKYYTGATKAEQKAYADLGALIKVRVANIEWGGDWKSFVDTPHYQLATGGKSTADMRKLFEAGKAFHP
jgi:peptidoglycan L-alanyl-D-glutamate endopeptidase CwlK